MKTIDLLLINGVVITMDKGRRVIENGAVAVEKDRIVAVGTTDELQAQYAAAKTLDCKDHIIMPGFVDAHGHGGHGLIRGLMIDTSYWMPASGHFYKNYVTAEYWYYEGKLNALERLRSGITTGVCVMGSQPVNPDPAYAKNNAAAYAEVGVRDIVCTGPSSLPWPQRFSTWKNGERTMREYSFEEIIKNTETVIRDLNHANGDKTRAFVTPFGAIASTDPSNPNPADRLVKLTEHDRLQCKEVRRIARDYDTRIHTDAFGGTVWLAYQDKENALLGPDVHIQHCRACTFDEAMILADTGTHVGATFESGAPVMELLGLGATVACTTDGPKLIGTPDMFAEMRLFRHVYKNGDRFALPAEKMLEMTTIDAAKAVGWDDELGSLEAGKKADIITVNLNTTRMTPRFNIVNLLVMGAEAGDIDNVFVDGEALLENSEVVSVDEKQILIEAQEETERSIERAKPLLERYAHPQKSHWGQLRRYDGEEQRFDIEWSRKDGGYY